MYVCILYQTRNGFNELFKILEQQRETIWDSSTINCIRINSTINCIRIKIIYASVTKKCANSWI